MNIHNLHPAAVEALEEILTEEFNESLESLAASESGSYHGDTWISTSLIVRLMAEAYTAGQDDA